MSKIYSVMTKLKPGADTFRICTSVFKTVSHYKDLSALICLGINLIVIMYSLTKHFKEKKIIKDSNAS